MRRRVRAIVMGLVFMVAGGFTFRITYDQYKLSQKAKNWPATEGEILSSEVVTYLSESGKRKVMYGPRITFEYIVNGERYTSHTVTFGELDSSDPREAQRIVRKYPKKRKVTVYYDPKAPYIAVLEPGRIGKGALVGLVLGVVFIAVGVLLTIGGIIGLIKRVIYGW